ncbi:hypothetical protein PAI11_02060 [Patulibacter medicamentivorans]|uniref:Regulator of polyketide synthase expression n=1 Tax=Patulibacter medicamentivorans TaxID=1097667 RepID=H0E098_9ACTN|nr:helix-turn-helix domain-containing protein [Patulibacter medicamentivorans]EHN12901.1 hypothetical protein PAI11_02060 [Patulibacter medicamentivorans]
MPTHEVLPTAPATVPSPGRDLVAALLDARADLASQMAEDAHARVPELGEVVDQRAALAETEGACRASVEQIAELLRDGRPATALIVPEAAREHAVGLVHRRITLAALLRTYRVAQNVLWSAASRHLRETADDDVVAPTLEALAGFLFEYVDLLCDDLVDAYRDEQDRWVRSAAAVRADTTRELLGGQALDDQVASSRLRYELCGHHVGLVLATDRGLGGGRVLEREAAAAARTLGCGEPLLVPDGASVLWAWCGAARAPSAEAFARLERYEPRDGVRLAIGRPARGIAGFRVTHDEARHAAGLSRRSPAAVGPTVSYRSVELVSLLATDVDRARRFVTSELGGLAAREAHVGRLRETLLSFLAHGGSHLLAAEALHLHKNTVYTRVRRAGQLLGAPITHRRVELQTALMLAVTLGDEVLGPRGDR